MFFVRELTRMISSTINAVRQELKKLQGLGIIIIKATQSNQKDRFRLKKYYQLNNEYFLFPELKALFTKSQILLENQFIQKIQGCGRIYYLALVGRFVGLEDFGLDMLIVGRFNRKKLKNIISQFEKKLEHEINYTLMSKKEFKYRKDITDRFLYNILETKKIVVVNEL